VTVYYCNQTDTPTCDPTAGATIVLTRDGGGPGVYAGGSGALSSPNDVGDVLRVLIRATDADGVFGEYADTIVLQP